MTDELEVIEEKIETVEDKIEEQSAQEELAEKVLEQIEEQEIKEEVIEEISTQNRLSKLEGELWEVNQKLASMITLMESKQEQTITETDTVVEVQAETITETTNQNVGEVDHANKGMMKKFSLF